MVCLLAVALANLTAPAAAASPLTSLEPPQVDPSLAAQLQSIIGRVQLERPIVGLAAAVTLADGSQWEGGSGQADLADATRLFSATSPSVVGSITKTFVAALVLQLVEEGRLSLRSRLSRWFPQYGFASRVRVRHLLQHTSGLRDYFGHPDYARLVFGRPTHFWTTAEILKLVRSRLLFSPGYGWSYSNTNYLFLALIVEKVTGATLASELRTRFFTPLGLDDTYVQGQDLLPSGAAHGYLRRDGQFVGLADGTDYRPHTSAATVAFGVGNVMSTASDIDTWTRALYGGQVLGPVSMSKMLNFNSADYGLGTRRFKVAGTYGWGHTGSLRGYTAVTWHIQKYGLTVTVLTNRGRIKPKAIARELSNAVLEWQAGAAIVAMPPAAYSVSPSVPPGVGDESRRPGFGPNLPSR